MLTRFISVLVVLILISGTDLEAQHTGKTVHFSKRNLLIDPYEGCAVADMNLDGHLDIVSGPYILFGPGFIPQAFRSNHLSSDFIHANSDHLYDVDRDGLLDIIIGSWGKEGMVWYRNPGNRALETGKPWEMHQPWAADTLAQTDGKMEMYALHDYDGDGLPEFHASCWVKEEPQQIWKFKRKSDDSMILQPFILGSEGGGHGYAFGDVNGDSREDLLCEIGWYERPEGDPFAKPWRLHSETDLSDYHPSCPFVTKDMNQDGRLDILFGRAHDYGLFWWEQMEPHANGTTTWKEHVIDTSWSQVHLLTWADLDNDGSEELIAGKCIWAHNGDDPGYDDPPVVYYYKWNPSSYSFTRHTIAGPDEGIGMGRQISVNDLNGDGWLDIVSPTENGLWILMNEGYANFNSDFK